MTVWCVLWGDAYKQEYVYKLARAVERHLILRHRFKCLTSYRLPGVQTVDPACDWPGWWQKIALFKPGIADEGVNLYIDLDSVVVGPLEPLLSAAPISMRRDFHRPTYNSGTICWQGGLHEPFTHFETKYQQMYPGDQDYLTSLLGDRITPINPSLIASYKLHCRGTGTYPPGTSIVSFHGTPKPHEVSDAWVQAQWR